MASLVYNSFYDDVARGNINPSVDTFRVMLVTSAYTEDKDTHLKDQVLLTKLPAQGIQLAG